MRIKTPHQHKSWQQIIHHAWLSLIFWLGLVLWNYENLILEIPSSGATPAAFPLTWILSLQSASPNSLPFLPLPTLCFHTICWCLWKLLAQYRFWASGKSASMDSLSTRRDRYSGTAKTRNNESPADERRRGKLNVRDVACVGCWLDVWDVGCLGWQSTENKHTHEFVLADRYERWAHLLTFSWHWPGANGLFILLLEHRFSKKMNR